MRAQTITIQTIPVHYRHVRCKICNGTGIDTLDQQTARCRKCQGTGQRLFPKGSAEKCPNCQGRGRIYHLSLNGTVCEECDGFGEVKIL